MESIPNPTPPMDIRRSGVSPYGGKVFFLSSLVPTRRLEGIVVAVTVVQSEGQVGQARGKAAFVVVNGSYLP